jgi:hypothetical protein
VDFSQEASPTLRITRRQDVEASGNFTFAVWNPFIGVYQSVSSLPEGLRRVDELASLIAQMRARRHPKLSALIDVPSADAPNADDSWVSIENEWAELRVNLAEQPTYDTRRSNQLIWVRNRGGKIHAAQTICNNVGYTNPI